MKPRPAVTELVLEGLPFAIVVGLVAFMVERDGAFAATVWQPVALLVLAAAVTFAWVGTDFAAPDRLLVFALAAFVAFDLWLFLSILWAPSPPDALVGASRTIPYVVVFALLCWWPTSTRALWPLLLAAAGIVAVEGIVTVLHVIRGGNPEQFLQDGYRLSEPLGYANATGALYAVMFWLMLGTATRRWVPRTARAAALGLASISLTLNLLTASRGSVYTFPLVAAAYLVLVPGRLRALAMLGVVGAGVLGVLGPLLHLYDSDHGYPDAYQRVLVLGLVWAVIVTAAGWTAIGFESRIELTRQAARRLGLGIAAAAVVVAVAASAVVHPWHWVQSGWHSFKYAGYSTDATGAAARFGGLGSNRYDFWRVALDEFSRHVVHGIGADNFLVPYLQHRRSGEQPLYPHSFVVDLLSQTGLVGTAIFAVFLALTVVVIVRIPAGRDRDLARVLLVGFLAWFLHAQVDWLWEMPVLGVLGIGLLGAAAGLARRGGVLAGHGRVVATAVTALALLAAVSLVPPWLANRDIQSAGWLWQTDPAAAFDRLDQARSLNPLSDDADLVAGVIALRLQRFDLARARLERAVDRNPNDWYARLELGIAASRSDAPGLAGRSFAEARRLNPGDRVVRSVAREFAAGRRIDPAAVDRAFDRPLS